MRNKNSRLEIIKIILTQQEIGKQTDLAKALQDAGYACTQATLSRDLRQLGVVKSTNREGKYVYLLPGTRQYQRVSDNHASLAAMQCLGAASVRFSGTMAVIKTLPGHAPHVAYDIDQLTWNGILGTVAGDDAVIVVLDEAASRDEFLHQLSLAGLYNKE